MTRVLAVEDSPTQAQALLADLEAAGFEVTLTHHGEEALQQLEAEQFDIVVSDVVMPGMDGYQLCRAIKENDRTSDLPVVLLTSLTDPLDVVSGLESGADNFLRKPYQPAQLVARLHAALRNRDLRRTGATESGIRLAFLEREFEINADRSQILDLLISTFEELVVTSREVRAREDDLLRAHSELQTQLQAVDLERTRLQAVVDSVPVPLFVLDKDGLVSHASGAGARSFGSTTAEMRGHLLEDIVGFEDSEGGVIRSKDLPHHRARELGEPMSTGAAFDVFMRVRDGSRLPVVLEACPVVDESGRGAGCVGTAQVLGSLTQYDQVTGLPNSAAYLDRASAMLSAPRGETALLLLELDRFDVTRAALGHSVGNEVLVEVSRRLRQVFEPTHGGASRTECFLAYLGSNQFGVLLADLPGSFNVLRLAEAARQAVGEPYACGGGVRLSASVGVALADKGHEGGQLFAAANVALRRALKTGGDHVEIFGHALSQKTMDRLQLEVDLRDAVEKGEIQLHYQPEVDLATGELLGFEALARWQHDRRGAVRPDVFIPLAEESGLIVPLGRQLLRDACEAASRWPLGRDGRRLSVSVNVSAIQLRAEFVSEVLSVLTETGLKASRLILEVTETAAMGDPDVTIPLLEELRFHGVGIALDDFGTGYSSMVLLTQVRFDQLKLDRGFVAGMHQGGRDAIVAQSIIALGDSLGIPVLAEGIETVAQANLLRGLRCDQGQGYLYARPIPAPALADLLQDDSWLTSFGGSVGSEEPPG